MEKNQNFTPLNESLLLPLSQLALSLLYLYSLSTELPDRFPRFFEFLSIYYLGVACIITIVSAVFIFNVVILNFFRRNRIAAINHNLAKIGLTYDPFSFVAVKNTSGLQAAVNFNYGELYFLIWVTFGLSWISVLVMGPIHLWSTKKALSAIIFSTGADQNTIVLSNPNSNIEAITDAALKQWGDLTPDTKKRLSTILEQVRAA